MTELKIARLGGGDDLAGAAGLLRRFFREEKFDTPDAVIDRNATIMAGLDTCGLFIAEAGGKPIGVATVSLEFGIEFGWSAEMGDLYVLPGWRGQGVSQLLIDAIEAFLEARGVSTYRVTLTAHAREDHDLGAYYAKLGFADDGRLILSKPLSG